MNRHASRIIFALLFCIGMNHSSYAFLFGEHKKIGDAAFKRFIDTDLKKIDFFSQALYSASSQCPLIISNNYFVLMPKDALIGGITYGDLTGMLADHAFDPMLLFNELLKINPSYWFANSPIENGYLLQDNSLIKVLLRHHYAIENGEKAANDFLLAFIQNNYVDLATEDSSHFYVLGENTIEAQLNKGAKEYLSQTDKYGNSDLINFSAHFVTPGLVCGQMTEKFNIDVIHDLFNQMHGLSALSKYAVLHTIVISMIDNVAKQMNHNKKVITANIGMDVQIALLFNACADHYLEDAFAAGHLSLDRSAPKKLNNKGTHDYYNRIGLPVSNKRGDQWTSHGDGFMTEDENYKYALEANTTSLQEIWDRLQSDLSDSVNTDLVYSLSGKSVNDIVKYFTANYKALNIVPIPVAPAEIKFKHSRNGKYCSAVYSPVADATISQVGINFGWGYNIKEPKKPIKWRENDIWLAFGAGFTINPTSKVFMASVFVPELNLYNLFIVGESINYISSLYSKLTYSPYVGLEYKGVKTNFSPSVNSAFRVKVT